MKVHIPILEQVFTEEGVVNTEKDVVFDVDTSVYSEERWEQNFPDLAKKEGLFQYAERIRNESVTDKVRVACMLKAIYCFIESDAVPTYKAFAQMFSLSVPEYTEKLIAKLKQVFEAVLGSSSVKN